MNKYIILFGILACTNGGCSSPLANSKTQALTQPVSRGNLEEITCSPAEGEYQIFGLIQESSMKEPTGLPFKNNFELNGQQEDAEAWIRFDTCLNMADETATLKRVVRRAPSAGAWSILRYYNFVPAENVADRGLYLALFGDISQLKMTFINQTYPDQGLLLMGHTDGQGQAVVTFSPFEIAVGDPLLVAQTAINGQIFDGQVSFGALLAGDPGIRKRHLNRKRISVGHVTMELVYEYAGTPGRYVTYWFQSVKIVDNNPALPQPIVLEAKGDKEIETHAKTLFSHHGLNDSFTFVFPEATFGIRNNQGTFMTVDYADPSLDEIKLPAPCGWVHLCGDDF